MQSSDRQMIIVLWACALTLALAGGSLVRAQDSAPAAAAADSASDTALAPSASDAAQAAPVAAPEPPPAAPIAAPPPPITPLGEKVLTERPKNDVTSLNASAGGAFNTGNTRAQQVNVGGDFRLVRNPHGVGANVAFAWGRAALPGDQSSSQIENVKNLNAKARYDFFVSQNDAIFLATGFRWDPFAGIDRRNQGQLGYLRYFVVEEKQRFWGELGYDITGDAYRQLPMKPAPSPATRITHSARLFVGYDNQLNEAVTYLGGLEVLMDVESPKRTRVNFDNALRSALGGSFKLELKFRLAADGTARADRDAKPIDTATLVSLLYTLI